MSGQGNRVTGAQAARFAEQTSPRATLLAPTRGFGFAASRRDTVLALAPAVWCETNNRPVVRFRSPSSSSVGREWFRDRYAQASSARDTGILPHFIRPHPHAAGGTVAVPRDPRTCCGAGVPDGRRWRGRANANAPSKGFPGPRRMSSDPSSDQHSDRFRRGQDWCRRRRIRSPAVHRGRRSTGPAGRLASRRDPVRRRSWGARCWRRYTSSRRRC